MEESGSQQPTIGLHQGNDSPHQAESGGSQHNNSMVNPQQRGDHEGSGKPRTLIGASRVGKVISPMQRMRETCNVRLTN